MSELIGRQIGGFLVSEQIGQGGMATVFRAYQPSVNRDVALKVIRMADSDLQSEVFRRRFNQEAEIIASLEHIHVLPIYDYGLSGDLAYLAMRLLRGGSVRTLLTEGPLELERAVDLFIQVAKGLAYAHSKGVIHRDLKPSNIMLDDSGHALLTDFGLAKMIEDSMDLTRDDHIVGTPAYMSPEQLRGDPLDHRADVYSMGVVLYQMLSGRTPFGGTSDLVSTIYRQLEDDPPSLRTLRAGIPPSVDAVVLRALQKEAAQRYPGIGEMAQDLARATGRRISSADLPAVTMQSPDVSTTEMPTLARAALRKVRRRRWLARIAGAAAMVAVLIVVLLLVHGGDGNGADEQLPPLATAVLGTESLAAENHPSADEIAWAKKRLSDEGFVAYITCNQSSEYHATQVREMHDAARVAGIEFRIYDSDTDEYRQLTLIENARSDGAVGLIICPLDPTLLDTTLRSAQKAGLPLVFLHSDIDSYGGVLLTGDEYGMGRKAGELAGRIIASEMDGQARVVVLGYPDLPALVVRANGLADGVLAYAPDAEILEVVKGGTREFGQAAIEALLADGVAFDVIVSINDAGSLGAIAALEEAGIGPDEVVITSIDAETAARDYILEGVYLRGSVDAGREQFSQAAIDAMIKLLAGSEMPERFIVPPGEVVDQSTLENANSLNG